MSARDEKECRAEHNVGNKNHALSAGQGQIRKTDYQVLTVRTVRQKPTKTPFWSNYPGDDGVAVQARVQASIMLLSKVESERYPPILIGITAREKQCYLLLPL